MDSPDRSTFWSHLRNKEQRAMLIGQIGDVLPMMLSLGLVTFITAIVVVGTLIEYMPAAAHTTLVKWVARTIVIITPVMAMWAGYRRHIKTMREMGLSRDDPAGRLRYRVRRVNKAISEAAELMDELRRDLAAQQAAREKIIAEAEMQQQLLEVNKEEAKKVRQIIVGETKRSIRIQHYREWAFFLVGLALSVPLNILSNRLGG